MTKEKYRRHTLTCRQSGRTAAFAHNTCPKSAVDMLSDLGIDVLVEHHAHASTYWPSERHEPQGIAQVAVEH